LAQKGATESDCHVTLSAFQRYSSVPGRYLPMNEDETERYPWMVLLRNVPWTSLAVIGLRLESLLCNEAVTERTNGTMRRFLSPLRMRMGRAPLSARLMLAKHGRTDQLTK
jgi:hypothetical protein